MRDKHLIRLMEAFQQRMGSNPNAVGSGGAGPAAAPAMRSTPKKPGMQGVAAPGTNKPMANPTVQAQATPTRPPQANQAPGPTPIKPVSSKPAGGAPIAAPKAGMPITKKAVKTPRPSSAALKPMGQPGIRKQIAPRRQNVNVNAPPSTAKPVGEANARRFVDQRTDKIKRASDYALGRSRSSTGASIRALNSGSGHDEGSNIHRLAITAHEDAAKLSGEHGHNVRSSYHRGAADHHRLASMHHDAGDAEAAMRAAKEANQIASMAAGARIRRPNLM